MRALFPLSTATGQRGHHDLHVRLASGPASRHVFGYGSGSKGWNGGATFDWGRSIDARVSCESLVQESAARKRLWAWQLYDWEEMKASSGRDLGAMTNAFPWKSVLFQQ